MPKRKGDAGKTDLPGTKRSKKEALPPPPSTVPGSSAASQNDSAAARFFDVPQIRQELYGYLDNATLVRIAVLRKGTDHGLLSEVAQILYRKQGPKVMESMVIRRSSHRKLYRDAVRSIQVKGDFSNMEYISLHYGHRYATSTNGRFRYPEPKDKIQIALNLYPNARQIIYDDATVDLAPGGLSGHITETCMVELPQIGGPAVRPTPGSGPADREADIAGFTHTRLVDIRLDSGFPRSICSIPKWPSIKSIRDTSEYPRLADMNQILKKLADTGYDVTTFSKIRITNPVIRDLEDLKAFASGLANSSIDTLDLCIPTAKWHPSFSTLLSSQLPSMIGALIEHCPLLHTLKVLVFWEEGADAAAKSWSIPYTVVRFKQLRVDIESRHTPHLPINWLFRLSQFLAGEGKAIAGRQDHQWAAHCRPLDHWTALINGFLQLDATTRDAINPSGFDLSILGIDNADDLPFISLDTSGQPLPVLSTLSKRLAHSAHHEFSTADASLTDPIAAAGCKRTEWISKEAASLLVHVVRLITALEGDDTNGDGMRFVKNWKAEDWPPADKYRGITEALKKLLDYVGRKFKLRLSSRSA